MRGSGAKVPEGVISHADLIQTTHVVVVAGRFFGTGGGLTGLPLGL